MVETILIAAAVIPALILLVRIYRLDRLEQEPVSLLLRLLVLGVLSTVLASLSEQLGDLILAYFLPETSLAYQLLLYFGVVAFSEEGFKYLLLKKQTWHSPHFNCQFDGVVYAVFVSLGFAIWENIGYVLRYGLATAMARALTAIPGHACFGVFMGVWYGVARRQEMWGYPEDARRSRVMAVVLPALLHGLYDFIATQQRESLSLVFVAFVAVLFVAAYRLAKRTASHDRFIDPNVGPYGDGNREE